MKYSWLPFRWLFGLSDVVQAYAGGIRLDTILVDEGFGSLDPESLDMAIRTLTDLQKGGRLVGIISHVAELKERISTRLEITPGPRGSSASFNLNPKGALKMDTSAMFNLPMAYSSPLLSWMAERMPVSSSLLFRQPRNPAV